MERLKDKKIPFTIILVSILMLIFGIITKDYYGERVYLIRRRLEEAPLRLLDVQIFGISFDYRNFLLFFIVTLGIGIYLFVYKNDKSLKNGIKKPAVYASLKNKYSKFENKSLPNKELDAKIDLGNESRTLSIVGTVSLFALCFTFFMAYKTSFSLWFFVILSYYHHISLKPKTRKEILVKSIGYPLIFLFLFMIIDSGDLYDLSRNLSGLSKHVIPFLIGVLIMFFTLRKRFEKEPAFNIKSPLLWVSTICLLVSIVRFGIYKSMETF
ncbi:hypothetical protein [Winogradskyella psychrotolerans]|uniref:hypothetical protein n=1 Tax=Winogradskyella psychrotolerans TaxID=1344585 RepID=UPI001C068E10|nr:hypothetical protein [Winogradskyella psychrotolerans]MBU2930164.1 hypothetical protein [Winogradskyella psychrotolerans]